MASEDSIWFRIGYALERSKQGGAVARKGLLGLAERAERSDSPGASTARPTREEPEEADGRWPVVDDLVALGVTTLVGELMGAWRPRHATRFGGLVRAGAAGAGAALLLDLVKPLLSGRPESPSLGRETGDRVLAGVGQGLLYGAVVEPRVPGPPLVKGALFASAEYVADPAGGLSNLLSAHTPHGRLPVVGELIDSLEPHDRAYLEHLVFGIALALLYGSAPTGNGSGREDDG